MRLAVAVAAVLSLALATEAREASADKLPSGRLSAITGLRNGTSAFGLGVLYGMEAAWEPLRDNQSVGYAVHWSVLFGDFGSESAAITGSLDILEMSVGARLRVAPRDPARTIFLGGGLSALRANNPLPPADSRSYGGGYLGFGVEQMAFSRALVTLEIRYGLIGCSTESFSRCGGAPGSVSVMLGVGLGV